MTDFERGAEAFRMLAVKIANDGGCDCHFAPCPHDDAGKAIAHRIRSVTLSVLEQQPPGSESREARMEKALDMARLAIEWAIRDDYDFGGSLRSPTADALNQAQFQIRRALALDASPEEKK